MTTSAIDAKKHRYRWWTLGVLAITVLIALIDQSILNVAIPSLQRELGATASQLQWMVNSYILIFGGLLLTMGSLGDRFGRARMLRGGLVVFGLSSLGAALVGSTVQLIAVRAVMGIGAAMVVPATLSILVDVFHGQERTKAIAIWAALAAMGVVLGPILGGLLLEHFYWGSVFLINVPIAVVAIVASLFYVFESRDPAARPLDVPGAILSIGAISSLVWALIEGSGKGWTSWPIVLTLVASLLLAAGFAIRQRSAEYPMLDLSFFQRRRFTVGVGTLGLTALALAGIMFGLTQYLQFVQGYTPLQAGVRFLPLAAGLMIGARGSEVLMRSLGTTRVVAGGLLVLAAATPLMLLWEADTDFWLLGVVFAAIGWGMGTVVAPATDAVMGAVPEEKAGVASAMNSVVRMVGASVGIAVMGSILFSSYSSQIADAVVGLPPELAAAAKDSVGAAVQIAATLPAEEGAALFAAAGVAFASALGVVGIWSASVAGVTALLVAKFMPSREEQASEDAIGEAAPVLVTVGPEAGSTTIFNQRIVFWGCRDGEWICLIR